MRSLGNFREGFGGSEFGTPSRKILQKRKGQGTSFKMSATMNLISSNDPRKEPHRAVKALASNIGVNFKSNFLRQRFRFTCSIEIVDYRLFVVVQTSIDFRKIFGHHKNSFLLEMNYQEIKKK